MIMRIRFNTNQEKLLLAILLIGILGILYSFYLYSHQEEFRIKSELAALLPKEERELQLLERTKEKDCQIQVSLPDKDCTPGSVFKNITKEEICVSGYTKTVRSVSTSLRKKVFAEYKIDYPQPYGSYEVDHLIPLALGGDNSIANLFPEAQNPYPGFKEKDVVENYLHEEVCKGNIALSVAQEQIAKDWLSIYNKLDSLLVKDYKDRYKSWAPDME
ncbi:MAG: hypothetical protein A3D35_00520 [Candidatus Staskawiczbacteria bacterium RIFCSPHIGHO2_02_FULL_34_9]|uniref:HNH nuclease domain-containing protein n=1 Tax=Candidatus Staskawiczbacteria bacterium RIFCSPHIGHO2_02_FULL_34_9 TaxID=1802206 RepID=A0A1G2I057_9BACT|nr:MAG: hypothetical protein A3D35_00520 [Candidatus Staskawiczbacteria bacterium RIFCSPHIGHO2_02_FULL_34_9]